MLKVVLNPDGESHIMSLHEGVELADLFYRAKEWGVSMERAKQILEWQQEYYQMKKVSDVAKA